MYNNDYKNNGKKFNSKPKVVVVPPLMRAMNVLFIGEINQIETNKIVNLQVDVIPVKNDDILSFKMLDVKEDLLFEINVPVKTFYNSCSTNLYKLELDYDNLRDELITYFISRVK